MEIPQLKGNPYQSEGFKEKDVNSFESTFNLEKAKLIRTGMWLLVLAHVFNCFIVGILCGRYRIACDDSPCIEI